MKQVLLDVLEERARQDAKWGDQSKHPDGTARALDKPALFLVRSQVEAAAAEKRLTWRHILDEEVAEAFCERDPVKLRTELIQVAAVAVAWCEALDKRAADAT